MLEADLILKSRDGREVRVLGPNFSLMRKDGKWLNSGPSDYLSGEDLNNDYLPVNDPTERQRILNEAESGLKFAGAVRLGYQLAALDMESKVHRKASATRRLSR